MFRVKGTLKELKKQNQKRSKFVLRVRVTVKGLKRHNQKKNNR